MVVMKSQRKNSKKKLSRKIKHKQSGGKTTERIAQVAITLFLNNHLVKNKNCNVLNILHNKGDLNEMKGYTFVSEIIVKQKYTGTGNQERGQSLYADIKDTIFDEKIQNGTFIILYNKKKGKEISTVEIYMKPGIQFSTSKFLKNKKIGNNNKCRITDNTETQQTRAIANQLQGLPRDKQSDPEAHIYDNVEMDKQSDPEAHIYDNVEMDEQSDPQTHIYGYMNNGNPKTNPPNISGQVVYDVSGIQDSIDVDTTIANHYSQVQKKNPQVQQKNPQVQQTNPDLVYADALQHNQLKQFPIPAHNSNGVIYAYVNNGGRSNQGPGQVEYTSVLSPPPTPTQSHENYMNSTGQYLVPFAKNTVAGKRGKKSKKGKGKGKGKSKKKKNK